MIEIQWECNRCGAKGVVEVEGRSGVDKAKGLRRVVESHSEQVGLACVAGIGSIDISVRSHKREGPKQVQA